MSKYVLTQCGCLLLTLGLAGCKEQSSAPPSSGAESSASGNAASAPLSASQSYAGKVVETMNSGGYTYVKVDTGTETLWAAAPPFKVKVGDPVTLPPGMAMRNFHSSTLNRDFDLIYFVSDVRVGDAPAASAESAELPAGHPPIPGMPSQTSQAGQPKMDFSELKPAEGGQTVADIFARRAELKGKEVKVRAKVVKFNAGIMGKNWLHLKDGTGTSGSNDLTVTTSASAKPGDTVLVTGKLALDKDFGYNYQYPVLVEDAAVTVE